MRDNCCCFPIKTTTPHMFETSLDCLGQFSNETLHEEYIIYWTNKRSRFSFVVATVLVLSWAIVETIGTTWYYNNFNVNEERVNVFYAVFSLILWSISLGLCTILFFSLLNFKNPFIYSYLQLVVILSMNIIFILKAIRHIHLGSPCSPNITSLSPDTDCPTNETFLSLINYRSVFTMCYSFQVLSAILYELRLYIVLGCHIITSAALLYSANSAIVTNLPAIIGFLMIGLVLIELHLQRIKGFLNKS